jgi:acyl carrier protein
MRASPSRCRVMQARGMRQMNVEQGVLQVLDEVLSLGGRSASFLRGTHLLGAVPELDSMAVVSIIAALEERMGIVIDDSDIDGSTFETVGSLVDFVAERVV